MKTKTEQNVIEIYNAYQSTRNTKVVDFAASSNHASVPVADDLSAKEAQVISIYHSFQSNRIPNREQVIQNVLSVARSHSTGQHTRVAQTTNTQTSRPAHSASVWNWLQSLLTLNITSGWQRAAAYSFVLVITVVISTIFIAPQNSTPTHIAVNIPDLLLENSQILSNNINPTLDPYFGLSSSQDRYQSAFRAGILLVELPLLVRTDQHDKLRQVVLEFNNTLKQTKITSINPALDHFTKSISLADDGKSRVILVNNIVTDILKNFTDKDLLPALDFGKWLETSLLVTQLPEGNRSPLLNELLQQGKIIAKQTEGHLSNERAVLALIEEIQHFDVVSDSTQQQMDKIREKLQQIKAALL